MAIPIVNLVALVISSSLSAAVSGEDPERSKLLNVSDHQFHWLIIFTVIVAIGCLMEIGEAIIEGLEWWWHRKGTPFQENDFRLTIPISIIGVVFVIVGVAGEGYFEAKQGSAETAIRQYDEQKLSATEQKAGSAADAATRAKDAADAVDTKVSQAQVKIDAAGEKADSLKVEEEEIEHRVHALQPRYFLLEAGKKAVIKSLNKYSGQPAVLTVCESGSKLEQMFTEFRLVDIFEGSRWKERMKDFPTCGPDKGSWSLFVTVLNSEAAPQSTRDAAKALTDMLNKTEVVTVHTVIDPKDLPADITFSGQESPWGWISENPSLIVIMIGDDSGIGLEDFERYTKQSAHK